MQSRIGATICAEAMPRIFSSQVGCRPIALAGRVSPLYPFARAPLYQILAAGEWRSPAFLQYLDIHQLERDAVIQAHCDESEEDDS